MSLLSLPNELILAIAGRLTRCRDVNALSQANRRLFLVLDSYLYQACIYRAHDAVLNASRHGLEVSMQKVVREAQVARLPLFQVILTAMESQHQTIAELLVPFLTQDHLMEADRGCFVPGYTLLAEAAKHGYRAVVRLLLENKKIDISSTPRCWVTPLFIAAKRGHQDIARQFLAQGTPVDSRDRDNFTPLMRAASNARDGMVAMLLARGASVLAQDRSGRTALSHAVMAGHEEVARILLDHGASTRSVDDRGRTPLWYAVNTHRCGLLSSEEPPTGMVQLLLEAGSDPNAVCQDGGTMLAIVSNWRSFTPVWLFIEHGADVQSQGIDWCNTFLNHAAAAGKIVPLTRLFEVPGVDIEFKEGQHGQTPLARAANNCWPEMVKLLLDRHADPNAVDSQLRTPLMLALQYDRTNAEEVVELLIKHGADPNAASPGGQSPLNNALARNNRAVVKVLLDNHLDLRSKDISERERLLLVAAAQGQTELVQALHDCSPDFGATVYDRAVQEAVTHHQIDICRLLFGFGANPNYRCSGNTLLMMAIGDEGPDLVKVLLEHGADAQLENNDGDTALLLAIRSELLELVKLLLSHEVGYDVDSLSNEAITTLYIAHLGRHHRETDSLVVMGRSLIEDFYGLRWLFTQSR